MHPNGSAPTAAPAGTRNAEKIARLLETLAVAVEAVASIDESLFALSLGACDEETLAIVDRQRAVLEADIRAIRVQLRALGAPPLAALPCNSYSPRTGGVHQDDAASGRPRPGPTATSQDAPPPSVRPSLCGYPDDDDDDRHQEYGLR